ncbi:MAG: hypothetical protein H6597_05125 [Flavobacteriales bacterium]|nr:hypothetical protein [Flavobacteriales bacterium]MCB9193896.1 hypothetical protein [Flavobacteriales bacterium]
MDERPLPLGHAAQTMGILSIPFAFLAQLVVPAAIMALMAVLIALWGRGRRIRYPMRYTHRSVMRMRRGMWAGTLGLTIASGLWVLYALGVLPF